MSEIVAIPRGIYGAGNIISDTFDLGATPRDCLWETHCWLEVYAMTGEGTTLDGRIEEADEFMGVIGPWKYVTRYPPVATTCTVAAPHGGYASMRNIHFFQSKTYCRVVLTIAGTNPSVDLRLVLKKQKHHRRLPPDA